MWQVDTIIEAVNGTAHRVENQNFTAVSTDSRTIGTDELFIPLKGPNFDGHLFVDAANRRSGGGSLCDKARGEIYESAKGTVILVDDTNKALLDLARFKRGRTTGTFIAITGSNGKTTTKELLVHLAQSLFPVVFNEKNYNNQIGVAKALLSIQTDPEYAIFELGTNHPGEIGVLARMVQPHMSLITNVNPSHLEGLSDLSGVLREKLSLFEATLPGGTIFINADDPSLASYADREDHRVSTFGMRENADFMLEVRRDRGLEGFDITLVFSGEQIETRTPLLGRHNLSNVLAAATLAYAMGVPGGVLREGIPEFQPYKGRFRPVRSHNGYTVVDDAYNANPASMEWALKTLENLPCAGRRIAILGDMRELGENADAYHRDLGRFLRNSNMALILLLGDEGRIVRDEIGNGRAKHFEDKKELINFVSGRLDGDDIVLVKGSRALGMDEIVEALV